METVKGLVHRARGALTTCGTRRKDVRAGSVAASMPPHGPASGAGTALESWSVAFLRACCSVWDGRIGNSAAQACGLDQAPPARRLWVAC
ncbi:hypothetical protein XaraCFBP7407_15345 [Xanthomonas arboricola pv. arracaciae]|nr:hypothetical protein XaraCFBP7407_15345 [Xanthomonas arboricola pv. arracaciae]